MDYGRLAIARALQDQNLGPFLDRGVEPEMMPDPDSKAVLKFLLDFFKQHRAVPSPSLVEQQFPGYRLGYAPDPTAFYIDEILKLYVRRQAVENLMSEAKKLTDAQTSPFAVVDSIRSLFGKLVVLGAESRERDIVETVAERLARYEHNKNNVGLLGIPTPWDSLDVLTQGWQPEDYVGVAGRPKSGKTWVMLRLAHKAWKEGYNVLFFNKEVKTHVMEQRLDAVEFLLGYQRLRTGMLTTAEEQRYRDGLEELQKNPPKSFFKFIHGANTVSEIAAKVEEYDPDIIFVDGAYLLTDEEKARAEWERQKNLSRALKNLAQKYRKPVIISIQLNRGGDIKNRTHRGGGVAPITLADVAGTDAYAQDVDLLIGIEQTEDMRAQKELALIPLAVREAEPTPIRVEWDFDTMESKDLGLATQVVVGAGVGVVGGVDPSETLDF